MSSNVLFYLAVGRLGRDGSGQYAEGKHVIVASASHQTRSAEEKDYKAHVKQIMDKGASKLKADKRIRLTADDNNYDLHVMGQTLSDTMIVYFAYKQNFTAVTDTGFGKAHSVAGLLDELKSNFTRHHTERDILRAKNGGSCHKASQNFLNNLLQKYGDDKLKAVQGKVDEVHGIMKDNVSKALDNVESLDELEDKSERFETQAKQFEKSATSVKKMMRCQSYKMMAIIIGIAVLIIVIIIIVVVSKKKNKG